MTEKIQQAKSRIQRRLSGENTQSKKPAIFVLTDLIAKYKNCQAQMRWEQPKPTVSALIKILTITSLYRRIFRVNIMHWKPFSLGI